MDTCTNKQLLERLELLKEIKTLEDDGDFAGCSNRQLSERIDLLRELAEIESE